MQSALLPWSLSDIGFKSVTQITLCSTSQAVRLDQDRHWTSLASKNLGTINHLSLPSALPALTTHVAQLPGAMGTPNSANFNRDPTNTNSNQLPLLAGPDL